MLKKDGEIAKKSCTFLGNSKGSCYTFHRNYLNLVLMELQNHWQHLERWCYEFLSLWNALLFRKWDFNVLWLLPPIVMLSLTMSNNNEKAFIFWLEFLSLAYHAEHEYHISNNYWTKCHVYLKGSVNYHKNLKIGELRIETKKEVIAKVGVQ